MTDQLFHTLISADELAANLSRSDYVILDCRFSLAEPDKGRIDYLRSHIPGAFFMDINHDLSSPVIKGVTGRHPLPNPEVLSSSLRAAGLNTASQVIVYDQASGVYAARAWWLLNWLGNDRVAVLDGGFDAWTAKGLATDNQWPPPKEGDFRFQLRDHQTITVHEAAKGTERMIDSREYKRFTGETEPIDPIAGHIPGAVCIPFMDNTDEQGFWKSADILSEKFSALLEPDGIPPVFYCGSGVSACHNILAFRIATGINARLYPGSWSEWINYYPAATGA